MRPGICLVRDDVLIAILAAGASRRLGYPKQLVQVRGEALLRRQCRIALEADIAPVAVILGCSAEQCVAQVVDLQVVVRLNHQWEEGMASSLREAARVAIEMNANGLLVLHGDQHRVTASDLQQLYNTWRNPPRPTACRARAASYAGPPVIMSSSLFDGLTHLKGEEGARAVLADLAPDALMDVAMPRAAYDLDAPEQLITLEAK